MTTPRVERFLEAQERNGNFDHALREMHTGQKRGHWIWYVFPQLVGLGSSGSSQFYGLDGLEEALEFLKHPVLRSRFLEITTSVAARLKEGVRLDTLMSSRIDTLKLVSSLTLLRAASQRLLASEGIPVYDLLVQTTTDVLDAAEAQGYPLCSFTLGKLGI